MPDGQVGTPPIVVFADAYQSGTDTWPPTTEPTGFTQSASAVTGKYDNCDAHAVQYHLPGSEVGSPHHRINKKALAELKAQGLEPLLGWALLDLDPKENPTMPEDQEERAEWLEARDLPPWLGWYTTTKGLRLYGWLARPVPVTLAEDWLGQFKEHIETDLDVVVDPDTKDWTRLMRLANVLREDTQLEADYDLPDGPIAWQPPRPLASADDRATGTAADDDMDTWPAPTSLDWSMVGQSPKLQEGGLVRRLQAGDPVADAGARNATTMTAAHAIAAQLSGPDKTVTPAQVWSFLAASVRGDTSHGAVTEEQAWRMCTRAAELEAGKYPDAPAWPHPQASERDPAGGEEPDDTDDGLPIQGEYCVLYKAPGTYWTWDENRGEYCATPLGASQLGSRISQTCPAQSRARHLNTRTGHVLATATILQQVSSAPLASVAFQVGSRKAVLTGKTDAERTLVLPAAVERCEAAYHQKVHDWLVMLGGDLLLDWLASVPQMSRPTSALYLEGPHGIGKGMLANAMGSIYGKPPINMRQASADFNDALLTCPIVFADEVFEVGYSKDPTAEIRRMTGDVQHSISIKHLPDAKLFGSPRLCVMANNGSAIKFKGRDGLTAEDLRAITSRITHIQAGDGCQQFFNDHGHWDLTDDWVWRGDPARQTPGLIAEHILWLRDTRKLTMGRRFLVEGKPTDWHRSMFIHHYRAANQVLEVVAKMVTHGGLHVAVDGNYVLVSATTVQGQWPSISSNVRVPDLSTVVEALEAISEGTVERDGKPYARVNSEFVVAVAERLHISTAQTMRQRMGIGHLNLV